MSIMYWNIDQNIIAGTSLRTGGVSKPPYDTLNVGLYVSDDPDDVIRNREIIAEKVGIPLSQWVFPKITHSDHFHRVTKDDLGKGAYEEANSIFDVDALYTYEKNIAIAIFHADCVPVLLYCPSKQLIGAVHAGWAGTIKQITSKFVQHWVEHEQCDPKDIHAYIGPALSQANFQVKLDVIHLVKENSPELLPYLKFENENIAYMDAVGMNHYQLQKHGILNENITIIDECTYDHDDKYFCFRKVPVTGRHLSFIYQK
jgi:polyphenol oxidase